jgi:hypothetical protein
MSERRNVRAKGMSLFPTETLPAHAQLCMRCLRHACEVHCFDELDADGYFIGKLHIRECTACDFIDVRAHDVRISGDTGRDLLKMLIGVRRPAWPEPPVVPGTVWDGPLQEREGER